MRATEYGIYCYVNRPYIVVGKAGEVKTGQELRIRVTNQS